MFRVAADLGDGEFTVVAETPAALLAIVRDLSAKGAEVVISDEAGLLLTHADLQKLERVRRERNLNKPRVKHREEIS